MTTASPEGSCSIVGDFNTAALPVKETPGAFICGGSCYLSDVFIDGGSLSSATELMRTRCNVAKSTLGIPNKGFSVAIRADDGSVGSLGQLNKDLARFATNHSYAETEAYARRIAWAWYVESYVHVEWRKPGRLRFRRPVYRHQGFQRIAATPGVDHWEVIAGATLEAAPPPEALVAGEWATRLSHIDAACDGFHRIVAALDRYGLSGDLSRPAAAVECCRAESRHFISVAAAAQSAGKSPELAGPLEKISDRLDALKRTVDISLAMALELALRAPAALDGTEVRTTDGRLDLEALVSGLERAGSHRSMTAKEDALVSRSAATSLPRSPRTESIYGKSRNESNA